MNDELDIKFVRDTLNPVFSRGKIEEFYRKQILEQEIKLKAAWQNMVDKIKTETELEDSPLRNRAVSYAAMQLHIEKSEEIVNEMIKANIKVLTKDEDINECKSAVENKLNEAKYREFKENPKQQHVGAFKGTLPNLKTVIG